MNIKRRSRAVAFTLIELLAVIAIISVLTGLILSAVQQARAAAARLQCQNNLRQLGLALQSCHDVSGAFPPGHRGRNNPDRLPFTGWTLDILPFLEQNTLYANARIAFQRDLFPFHNPPHAGLSTVVRIYCCPSDPRIFDPQLAQRSQFLVAFLSYPGVSGENLTTDDGILYQDSHTRLQDVTDGSSNTLLVGERPPSTDFQFGWWYAGIGQRFTGSGDQILGVRERNLLPVMSGSCPPGAYPFMTGRFTNQCDMFHFWSPHLGGANFVFADGSVHFLSYSANPIMPALASRAGGEPIALLY